MLFLAQLTRHLGFYPQYVNQTKAPFYFDLREGIFTTTMPYHQLFLENVISADLLTVFKTNFEALEELSVKSRKLTLNALLNYYSLHLSNFDNLKSKYILEEILN